MIGEKEIVRALVCAALLCSGTALAEDRVTAGAASAEPPTLISLGFDWVITGDDNRNAAVTVEYRRSRRCGVARRVAADAPHERAG